MPIELKTPNATIRHIILTNHQILEHFAHNLHQWHDDKSHHLVRLSHCPNLAKLQYLDPGKLYQRDCERQAQWLYISAVNLIQNNMDYLLKLSIILNPHDANTWHQYITTTLRNTEMDTANASALAMSMHHKSPNSYIDREHCFTVATIEPYLNAQNWSNVTMMNNLNGLWHNALLNYIQNAVRLEQKFTELSNQC